MNNTLMVLNTQELKKLPFESVSCRTNNIATNISFFFLGRRAPTCTTPLSPSAAEEKDLPPAYETLFPDAAPGR